MASRRPLRTGAAGVLLLGLLASAALGCGTSSSGGSKPMEVGLEDDAVFVTRSYYDRDKALLQARQLGVTRLRVLTLWNRLPGAQPDQTTAPAQVSYDWSAYDSLISAAAKQGIRLQLDLSGPAPAWAAGNRKPGPFRPDVGRFREFVSAAVRHFKGRVDRYSIWNEPNYVSWLAPSRDAASIYRRLYIAAYGAIKRLDPRAQVLIGETSPYEQAGRAIAPLAFLRGVTCRTQIYAPGGHCAPLLADGYAHHPYDFANPPERPYPGADNVTVGSLARLTGALDKLAAGKALRTPQGKPLDVFLTEFGYFAAGPVALSPARHGAYLRRAFDIAQRNTRVRQMLQYILVAPPPPTRFNTSLVRPNGTPEAQFDALASWSRENAKSGRVVAPGPPVRLKP